MGIQDLMKVIKDNARKSIYTTTLSQLKGKRVAIDTSIWEYRKFRELLPIYIEENEDEPDADEFWVVKWEPLRRRWLGAMLEIASSFLKEGVTPIFIFEDTSSPIKKEESEKRELERQRLEERYQEIKGEFEELSGRFERSDKMEKYKKAFSNQIRYDRSFSRNFYEVLKSLGVPVYYSIEESDFLIAALSREGIIDSVYSTDTDLIVYGIPYVITGTFSGNITIIDRKSFLEEIEFTPDQLIDLAILLGTDYNQRVRGVGPVNAVRLISQYKKLELVPSKYYTFTSNRSIIRDRFKNIPSVVKVLRSEEDLTFTCDISCQEIISEGIERLRKHRLSERWEKLIQ